MERFFSLLNAESQRIARRDKKPFLSDQCKEIEENNRMGKTKCLMNYGWRFMTLYRKQNSSSLPREGDQSPILSSG